MRNNLVFVDVTHFAADNIRHCFHSTNRKCQYFQRAHFGMLYADRYD